MLRRLACLSALVTLLIAGAIAFLGYQGWQWFSARQQTDQRLSLLGDAWAASPASLKAARGGIGDVRPPGVDAAPWSVPRASLPLNRYRDPSARKLTVTYSAREDCAPVVDVRETPDVVVIAMRCEVTFNPLEVAQDLIPRNSTAFATLADTSVTLDEALGTRIVVDASSGASVWKPSRPDS